MSDAITLVPNQTSVAQGGQIFAQESGDSAKLAQDFDDFLTLLTTQLQNQDPLNPTDSTEFTNQLVQFNQVEQQINSNTKLDELIAATQANSLQQALGYIGLDVSYEGQQFYNAGDGNGNRFVYDLSDDVASLTLRVVDASGDTVYTELVNEEAGLTVVEWDGKDDNGSTVAPGNYSIRLDVVPINQTDSVSVELGVSSRVTGIETRAGVTYLAMGEVVVPLGQVFSAELPNSAGFGSTGTIGDGESTNATDNSGDDTVTGDSGSDGSDTTGGGSA